MNYLEFIVPVTYALKKQRLRTWLDFMSFESQKTSRARDPHFADLYFSGTVFDIGCGNDLVVPHAQPFDRQHGDANEILKYLKPEAFDTVHSSHCLEHMNDVTSSLHQWWTLVKPGGHMIVVVPHEDLYEQGNWPSVFNPDHKATFRLDKAESWSPVSYDLRQLASSLPNCEIIDAVVQDNGYDHSVRPVIAGHRQKFLIWLHHKREAIRWHLNMQAGSLNALLDRIEHLLGKPNDQTEQGALAQIQIVLHKRKLSSENIAKG